MSRRCGRNGSRPRMAFRDVAGLVDVNEEEGDATCPGALQAGQLMAVVSATPIAPPKFSRSGSLPLLGTAGTASGPGPRSDWRDRSVRA